MKNTTSDEDGKRSLLLAIIITIVAVIAFLYPMPPAEAPQEPVQVPHFVETAEAGSEEPKEVRIATTSNHVVEADEKVVDNTGDYYETLADNMIQCESGGRNIEIIDTNGKWSRGVAMFQDSTWDWLSGLAGVTGSSMEPEKARAVLLWSLKNGYGEHWYTCYHRHK